MYNAAHSDQLTGKCKNDTNEVDLSGNVDGDNVAWKYDLTYEGMKLTLAFTGKLESAA